MNKPKAAIRLLPESHLVTREHWHSKDGKKMASPAPPPTLGLPVGFSIHGPELIEGTIRKGQLKWPAE